MKPAWLLLLPALGACTPTTAPPGTGWSRAPDLSAYSAMVLFADIAREQSVLCGGFSPGVVARRWDEDFGAREAAIAAALAARHGTDAVARAEAEAVAAQRVPCSSVPNLDWRYRYGRMLRLLEARLGRA